MNKFYFVFSLVGTITHALWGYVVTLVNDHLLVDSFSHRFMVVLPFQLLIIYSYFKKKFNLEYITYLGILVVTTDYCYLIAINNRTIHTTGLYVILTASLSVINKRWFLWLYSLSFTLYCIYSILFVSITTLEKTHWGNMLTLIGLMTFFGIWRIKNNEQLEVEYAANLEKSKKLEELNNIAAQAAHDIRSPLTALKSFITSSSEIEPKKLKIVIAVEKRINEIANFLVEEYRKNIYEEKNISSKDIFENLSVTELVDEIVREKLLLQSEYKKFKIILSGKINFLIDDIRFQIDLKRILSNLIINSIEAFQNSNGIINITLDEDSTWFTIQISDNGKGIPTELLDKVFEKGSSFGKVRGTGLGLSHAKEAVQKYRGEINLESKINSGTKISLIFNKV